MISAPTGRIIPDLATAERQESQLLLTPRAAAAALSISERKLWAMTHPRGTVPVLRLGRSIRYSPDALRAWIIAQQPGGEL
jgi:hypothetical protein